MSFYNHALHNEFQTKINNETNIRIRIFKELEFYKTIISDDTIYPLDQDSLHYLNYPLAGNRGIPEISISDYIMSLNNYKLTGNLFTVRYVNSEDRYSEVIFLDPNDNGQVWLFIFT